MRVALVLILQAGCTEMAIRSAPPKQPVASTTEPAKQAVRAFWDNFFAARYDQIPNIRTLLTAAYLENPNDPEIALLLTHTQLWAVSERSRLDRIGPEITDHLILAERYLEEAKHLAPDDLRIPGWLGDVKMALGQIHQDERLTRTGYFMAKGAAQAYPEFNGFTFSYGLVSQPYDSPQFRESVEWMWENLRVCTGRTYDRFRPEIEYRQFASLRTEEGPKRVCWNTPRVPHNVEGFFLHFGDVLLKNGQREAAEAAYGVIKQVPEYTTWRYKAALEERLSNAGDWIRRLRAKDPKNEPPYLFNSPIACVACHAR